MAEQECETLGLIISRARKLPSGFLLTWV